MYATGRCPTAGLRRTRRSWVFVRRKAGAHPLSYTGTPPTNFSGLPRATRSGSTSSCPTADAVNTSLTATSFGLTTDQAQWNMT